MKVGQANLYFEVGHFGHIHVTQMVIYYLTILPPKMSLLLGESGQQNWQENEAEERLPEGHLVLEAKMKGKENGCQRRNALRNGGDGGIPLWPLGPKKEGMREYALGNATSDHWTWTYIRRSF